MTQLEKDIEFLREDLQKNHNQNSWDWEADFRFAVHRGISGEEKGCAKDLLRGKCVAYFAYVAHKKVLGKYQKARLRALREMVHRWEVKSAWVGTGHNGKIEWGVNRVRSYRLLKESQKK